jgi:YgiT-type zinc finger domain-containing protein
MYGYRREYWDGTVQERIVERQAFEHRDGFVILEDIPVSVCDKCGYRYSHSALLHRVQEIAAQKRSLLHAWSRTLSLPLPDQNG